MYVAFVPFKASVVIFAGRKRYSCAFHSFKCKKAYKNDHGVCFISLRESTVENFHSVSARFQDLFKGGQKLTEAHQTLNI